MNKREKKLFSQKFGKLQSLLAFCKTWLALNKNTFEENSKSIILYHLKTMKKKIEKLNPIKDFTLFNSFATSDFYIFLKNLLSPTVPNRILFLI